MPCIATCKTFQALTLLPAWHPVKIPAAQCQQDRHVWRQLNPMRAHPLPVDPFTRGSGAEGKNLLTLHANCPPCLTVAVVRLSSMACRG